MRLKAEPQGGGYLLNGTKMWITNGPDADVVVVYAKTEPGGGRPRHHRVHRRARLPRISPPRRSSTSSACAARTPASWYSRTASCPRRTCSAQLNEGVRVLMSGLDYERLVLAGGPLGIMQACLDAVLPYIHERRQFGQPIGEFQLIQGKVADMYTTLNACKAYVYAVARAADAGGATRKDAAGAILYASERATRMALDAIQILGGNGYINEYPTGGCCATPSSTRSAPAPRRSGACSIGRELFNETDLTGGAAWPAATTRSSRWAEHRPRHPPHGDRDRQPADHHADPQPGGAAPRRGVLQGHRVRPDRSSTAASR